MTHVVPLWGFLKAQVVPTVNKGNHYTEPDSKDHMHNPKRDRKKPRTNIRAALQDYIKTRGSNNLCSFQHKSFFLKKSIIWVSNKAVVLAASSKEQAFPPQNIIKPRK